MAHIMSDSSISISYTILLDGEWDFTYTPDITTDAAPPLPPSSAYAILMPVPGYWDDYRQRMQTADFWPLSRCNPTYRTIDFPISEWSPDVQLPYLYGIGWYRRTINLPNGTDKSVVLTVGGVLLEAWVWLNGQLVAHHLGHSTPFDVDLTPYLVSTAPSELVIAVSNTRRDRCGCVIRGYAGQSGGIYRPVSLRITDRCHIDDVYVYHEMPAHSLRWQVALRGQHQDNLLLAYQMIDPADGSVVLDGAVPVTGNRVQWETATGSLHYWSDRNPRRYQLIVSLVDGTCVIDRLTQPFGLRRLAWHKTALFLNGDPIYLRGVCECAYFPETCTPPQDIVAYRKQIRVLKQLGFNWLRFHTWVPSEEYLTAADELGMLIQVEPPTGFKEQEWLDILLHCRKHPSVVIYCCGNEDMLDEAKIESLCRMAHLCRAHVPDGLFNPQEALVGVEYGVSDEDDGYVAHPFPHNARRLEALKSFSDLFGNYSWGQLSYYSVHGDWRRIDENLIPYARPCLSHEVGIHGNYPNIDLEHRYVGTRIGTTQYAALRVHLARARLLKMAPRYFQHSCAWMRILRKHAVEMARKCHRLAGYDLLGATDNQWLNYGYPCGMMNEFFEMKPGESIADVLRYNSESILLLDHGNQRNYTADDAFHSEIYISHFGSMNWTDAALHWRLLDDQQRTASYGVLPVASINRGEILHIGTIACAMPMVENGTHLTLHVRLLGNDVDIDNQWDFWVFPARNSLPEGITVDAVLAERFNALRPAVADMLPAQGVYAAAQLTPALVSYCAAGGSVAILGVESLPCVPFGFQISQTSRGQGHLATVIADHPLMNGFPHAGYCDWQFYTMMEEGHVVLLDKLGVPLTPIIDVASAFKTQPHFQAALFEMRVNAGRLFICSLHLTPQDPASREMLWQLFQYLKSMRFQPASTVAPEMLISFITESDGAVSAATPVTMYEVYDSNAHFLD